MPLVVATTENPQLLKLQKLYVLIFLNVRIATKREKMWDVQTEIISHLLSTLDVLGEGKWKPWTHVHRLIFLQPRCLIPLDRGERGGQVRIKRHSKNTYYTSIEWTNINTDGNAHFHGSGVRQISLSRQLYIYITEPSGHQNKIV
jgi:hypothetical protein